MSSLSDQKMFCRISCNGFKIWAAETVIPASSAPANPVIEVMNASELQSLRVLNKDYGFDGKVKISPSANERQREEIMNDCNRYGFEIHEEPKPNGGNVECGEYFDICENQADLTVEIGRGGGRMPRYGGQRRRKTAVMAVDIDGRREKRK
ncbi:hypothetical protein COLO4_37903 [Corchorus olitorius]|uniref:Uncharacterized protein n=1 Tax=Corchorus olitorius TaxID=93759 RepID=A0A1R3FY31_9ROSI|nr:hypothetical protein COLO4_37903 [Corchorus olitorius]